MKDKILKHLLKNVLDFGSINQKAVLGAVLRENSSLKKDVPKVLAEISKMASEVEGLSKDEIKNKLKEINPELLKEKKEIKNTKGTLKSLKNAEQKKVVVRIAPSPSGSLHVGHAYGASLNHEYARMYGGKFILRIEDTNPENIYPNAYKLIEDDANWLTGNKVDQLVIQSDRLGLYYDSAEKLVQQGNAYVCTCNADEWRELKNKGKACPCRKISIKENQIRYAKMFNEYAEGEAILRLKTDIKDKNPAMRDFGLMRVNEHIHPKTGKEQRVWPLMVLSVAIDDHELGVTHVLNGKDHTDNAIKETLIMKMLGWEAPEYQHWGRINFEGFSLSSSKTRLAIEQNEYHGWDDIRLPTLPALRRRGYHPGAFLKFATKIGLSLNDKTVSKEEFWKMINAFNKEIVEEKANRYYFVNNPLVMEIEKAPKRELQIDLHPDFPKRGKRVLSVKGKVYIAKDDWKKLAKGKIHRLMDYCNFMFDDGIKFHSEDYEDYKNAKNKGLIIHWLPVEKNLLSVEVLLEDGSLARGLGENTMKNLKEGDIVQLERQFFARVDKVKKNKIDLWYLHK